MQLGVYIECVRCGQKEEIHMVAGWDISNVRHNCEADHPARVRAEGERPWEITFNPPRRAF